MQDDFLHLLLVSPLCSLSLLVTHCITRMLAALSSAITSFFKLAPSSSSSSSTDASKPITAFQTQPVISSTSSSASSSSTRCPSPLQVEAHLKPKLQPAQGSCPICLESDVTIFSGWTCTNPNKTTGDLCRPGYCVDCMGTHFSLAVKEMGGYISPLKCPCCLSFVPFKSWSLVTQFTHPELAKEYRTKASNILSIMCPECHDQRSLLPSIVNWRSPYSVYELRDRVILRHNKEKAEEFLRVWRRYRHFELTPKAFMKELEPFFHTGPTLFWALCKILKCSTDPERSVSLLLAMFKRFSSIIPLACRCMNICYYCHTREELHTICRDRLDNDVLEAKPCPQCGVMIARSEGCDYVVCVCGAEMCYFCGMDYDTCPCSVEDEEEEEEEEEDGEHEGQGNQE